MNRSVVFTRKNSFRKITQKDSYFLLKRKHQPEELTHSLQIQLQNNLKNILTKNPVRH